MSLDLRLMRYVIAVAEEGGFQRAAERLRIAQPSLSRQVHDLERELGATLFERRPATHPTEAGRVFVEYARTVLAGTDRLVECTKQAGRGEAGDVHVGVIHSTGPDTVPRIAAAMRGDRRGIALAVRECWSPDLDAGLRSGRFDLVLSWELPQYPDYRRETLRSERLVAVVDERHPLARRGWAELREFGGHRFCHPPRRLTPGWYDHMLRALKQADGPYEFVEIPDPDVSRLGLRDHRAFGLAVASAVGRTAAGTTTVALVDDLPPLELQMPDEIPGGGWSYGVDPDYLKGLIAYWRTGFDWHAEQSRLNRLPNFQVTVDGMALHVIHARGRGPRPLPLLLTHGWPSSCYEAIDLIPLLTDPASHGGDPADAFDVIVPSLPGFGFSDRPAEPGVNSTRIGAMLVKLMSQLGYERFAAHGYDVGASILSAVCLDHPEHVIAYHTTEPANAMPYTGPGSAPLTDEERAYLELQDAWYAAEGGYDLIQATRPQTLAYSLNDSPAGLAAWIIDKWFSWTDPSDGDLGKHFTAGQLLANATIYWATGTINSANRLYYEREHSPRVRTLTDAIRVPTGVALTTQAIERAPRAYLERIYTDIRYWRDLGSGGHFIMLEHPELLADSLRSFFRMFR